MHASRISLKANSAPHSLAHTPPMPASVAIRQSSSHHAYRLVYTHTYFCRFTGCPIAVSVLFMCVLGSFLSFSQGGNKAVLNRFFCTKPPFLGRFGFRSRHLKPSSGNPTSNPTGNPTFFSCFWAQKKPAAFSPPAPVFRACLHKPYPARCRISPLFSTFPLPA